MDQLAAAAQGTGQFLTNTALPRLEQGAGLGLDLVETLRSLENPGGFFQLQANKAKALQDPAFRAQLQNSPFLAGTFGLGLQPNLATPESAQASPPEGPSISPMPNASGAMLVPQLPPLGAGARSQQALNQARQQLIQQDPMGVARSQLHMPAFGPQDLEMLSTELEDFQKRHPTLRGTIDRRTGMIVPATAPSQQQSFDVNDVLSRVRAIMGQGAGSEATPTPTGDDTPAPTPTPAPAPASDDQGPVEGLPTDGWPVSPSGQVGAPAQRPGLAAPAALPPPPPPMPQQAQTANPSPAFDDSAARVGYPSQAFNDPGRLVQNRQARLPIDATPTGSPTPGVSQGTPLPVTAPQQPDAIQAMPLNVKSMTIKSKGLNVTMAPPKLTAQQVSEAENVKQIKGAIRETLDLLNQGTPRDFSVPGLGTIPKGGQSTGPLVNPLIGAAKRLRDPFEHAKGGLLSSLRGNTDESGKVPMDPLQVRQGLLESGTRRMFDVAFIFAGKRVTNQEIERMFRPLVPDLNEQDDVIRAKMLGISDILQNIDSERNKLLQLDPGEDKEGTFEGSPRGKALYGDIFGAQARRFLMLQQVPPPKRLDQAQPQP